MKKSQPIEVGQLTYDDLMERTKHDELVQKQLQDDKQRFLDNPEKLEFLVRDQTKEIETRSEKNYKNAAIPIEELKSTKSFISGSL